MGKVDFSASIKTAEKEGYISGGDYFKLKEGANRFRLVTECLPHRGEYKGTPNFKWLCYVLDRVDGQVKTFFMAHIIYKQIAALQKSEDYAFDETPMPYDITINAIGAGTKEVTYTVVPARKNTELTLQEQTLVGQKKPIEEVQQTIYAKAADLYTTVQEMKKDYDPDDTGPSDYPATGQTGNTNESPF